MPIDRLHPLPLWRDAVRLAIAATHGDEPVWAALTAVYGDVLIGGDAYHDKQPRPLCYMTRDDMTIRDQWDWRNLTTLVQRSFDNPRALVEFARLKPPRLAIDSYFYYFNHSVLSARILCELFHVDPNETNRRFFANPLFHAVFTGNEQCVRVLLAVGADAERWVLYEAVIQRRCDIVDMLLEHGASVNPDSDDGFGPLHAACSFELSRNCPIHPGVVERLLRAGADVNQADGTGWTPLHCAAVALKSCSALCCAAHGPWDRNEVLTYLRVIDMLTAAGAVLDVPNNIGTTPARIIHQWFRENRSSLRLRKRRRNRE